MAEQQQPKRPRRSQIDQWRTDQNVARNRDQKPKFASLPSQTMFPQKSRQTAQTAAVAAQAHEAAQAQRRAPATPQQTPRTPNATPRAPRADRTTLAERYTTTQPRGMGALSAATQDPAQSAPVRQESQPPASGALAAAAPPSAQNPTTRLSGRGGGGNRGRTGHNTPAPSALREDTITRIDGSVVPLAQVNQERRVSQEAALSHPQAPMAFGAFNARGESFQVPQAPARESARDRFMRVAREEQLLKQGFLPEGSKVQKTFADQRADRLQDFAERTDKRDFEYKRGRDSRQDLMEEHKTRAQVDMQSQQAGYYDAQRRSTLAQLEAETNKMAAEDPRFRKMPVWNPTDYADLDADQRLQLQDEIAEQRLAMQKAGVAYRALANQYGTTSLESLLPRLSEDEFNMISPILDLSALTQSPRRYAEGGPVYNAPPDAASAESALGRYRDYMVQARQMGLPTIPFEQFAQIQEASGPVQRYAMGGALQAHAQNAEKMASSGALVDIQGLQEQALANEVRGQDITAANNMRDNATSRDNNALDNQTSRDNNALDNQTSRLNNTADNRTSRFNTVAENPNALNLADTLQEEKGLLDFARGGPVPGALEAARQAPSEPKFVMDPDPDAPVDSIPAVIDDHQPARLNSGEFVFPTDVVQFYGLDRLNKMIAAARKGQETQGA